MAEWTDIAGLEWTDLASPEWEGDLSVTVGDCPALAATAKDAVVRIDCIQNVTAALTIQAAAKEPSVQIDCAVTLGAPVGTLTVAAQEPALNISSSHTEPAAISLSLAVLSHVGDVAWIVGQTLLQLTMIMKTPFLSIVSDVQVDAALELTAAMLEPDHVGVVSIAEVTDPPALTAAVLSHDVVITNVTVEPAALPLVVTPKEPESISISLAVVMTAPIAMTAAIKAATVQTVSMAALSAPIAIALTPKEPALVSGATHVILGSAMSLSVTPKAASVHHDNRAVMGQVIPIKATAKAPSLIISPSVSVSAPLVMSLAVLGHGTQFNQDVELSSPPTLALAAQEPQGINLSSSPPADVIGVTITVQDATVSISVSHEEEASLLITASIKSPTYMGPTQAEGLIVNSYITIEKVIESDIDIRMYAYG